jgi:peptide/nickel transport system substrate-binding protein
VFALPIEGWNFGSGAICGWFGIEAVYSQPLLAGGPAYLRSDKNEPFPALVTDWSWSTDGKTLTMNLIKGAKWSDGAPFNADDVMFTWEDNINDPNVSSQSYPVNWEVNGKPTQLRKVNDYQIQFIFAEAFPVALLWSMATDRFYVSPSHFFKPLHPKYNPRATYESYKAACKPTELPAPTMGPWVPAQYKVNELLVMKRNPYYWKVDSNGKQLPYVDEVHFVYSSNSITRTTNTMAGTADLSNVGETYDEVARQASQSSAEFTVDWQGDSHAYGIEFQLDSKFGAETPQDNANRALFRDVRFRRALTLALDRDGIARSLAQGPFFRAWGGGLLPGSPLFTRESVYFLPYSMAAANTLLDEMGLKKGNDGYRTYPAGSPMAGKRIEIQIHTQTDLDAEINIATAANAMYKDAGIMLTIKQMDSTALSNVWLSGKWDLRVFRYDSPWLVPNAFPSYISPLGDNVLGNHYKIVSSGDALPFENDMNRIAREFSMATDPAKQKQLMADFNRIYTENAYTIGVVTATYGMLLNKNIKNIQPGLITNLYSWGHQSMFMEQIWFDPAYTQRAGRTLILGNTLPLNYPKL